MTYTKQDSCPPIRIIDQETSDRVLAMFTESLDNLYTELDSLEKVANIYFTQNMFNKEQGVK